MSVPARIVGAKVPRQKGIGKETNASGQVKGWQNRLEQQAKWYIGAGEGKDYQ